jgi:hypothetical protein
VVTTVNINRKSPGRRFIGILRSRPLRHGRQTFHRYLMDTGERYNPRL